MIEGDITATCHLITHRCVDGGAHLADTYIGTTEGAQEVVEHVVLNLHDLLQLHAPPNQETARAQVHRPECAAKPADNCLPEATHSSNRIGLSHARQGAA